MDLHLPVPVATALITDPALFNTVLGVRTGSRCPVVLAAGAVCLGASVGTASTRSFIGTASAEVGAAGNLLAMFPTTAAAACPLLPSDRPTCRDGVLNGAGRGTLKPAGSVVEEDMVGYMDQASHATVSKISSSMRSGLPGLHQAALLSMPAIANCKRSTEPCEEKCERRACARALECAHACVRAC
eukprot:scpid83949/ scgid35517/ 